MKSRGSSQKACRCKGEKTWKLNSIGGKTGGKVWALDWMAKLVRLWGNVIAFGQVNAMVFFTGFIELKNFVELIS